MLTDVGAVDLAVPRDRNGRFAPKIVRKGQTRLDGFNDRIIALYARGMTTRDAVVTAPAPAERMMTRPPTAQDGSERATGAC